MAYGYVVVQVDVNDAEAYKAYAARVQPTLDAFGGEFLARGGRAETVEGTPNGPRNVIVRFPSYEAAQEWWRSEIYSEPKAMRQAAANSVMTIVEGV